MAWYSSKLDSHPLLTKGITSGLVAGTGDFLCQWITHDPAVEDWWNAKKTLRFGFLGAFLVAPAVHFWYGGLAKHFPGTSTSTVAKRVFMDQFVFTPVFLPIWFSSMWTLEKAPVFGNPGHAGDARSSYMDRWIDIAPDLLVANWSYWIPAVSINFKFVPLKYQVLYANVLSLIWNMYLSFSTDQVSKKEEVLVEAEEVR